MDSRKIVIGLVILLSVVAAVFFVVYKPSHRQLASAFPKVGDRYLDLSVFDGAGKPIRLSSLEGSVILIQFVRMSGATSQALAGANLLGSIGDVKPQAGLPNIEKLFVDFTGGVKLGDQRIRYVELIFSNLKGNPPSTQDVEVWENHFYRDKRSNHLVAGLNASDSETVARFYPGFHLVDKHFFFRVDGSGPLNREIYTQLFPLVARLMLEP